MKIKHIHPTYESPQARAERLKDTGRVCIALIQSLGKRKATRRAKTA